MGRVLKVLVVVLALALALALAGCSLFMRTNPESWEPRLAPTCSVRKTAPLLDTIAAGVGVVAASVGWACLATEDGDTARDRCLRFALAPGIAVAVIYGIPAVVGWRRIGQCRSAKRKHEDWLRPQYPSTDAPKEK